MSGFLAGGANPYEKALRQEYESARASLLGRIKECRDPAGREAMEKELRELTENFESRFRKIRECLFGMR
ncbi:MAG TPA: hypothetical protein VJL29_05015 [Thermoguttaceae bacterium]|nr:hypothetical protein [Thermoguttaceae bacterium]